MPVNWPSDGEQERRSAPLIQQALSPFTDSQDPFEAKTSAPRYGPEQQEGCLESPPALLFLACSPQKQ